VIFVLKSISIIFVYKKKRQALLLGNWGMDGILMVYSWLLSVCLVGFSHKHFYNTSKVKIEFSIMFGLVWLFRIASILQKQFWMKLQFLAFELTKINSLLNFIFWLLQPIIFFYCLLSIYLFLYLIWGTKFNQKISRTKLAS